MTQELWHTSAPRGLKPGTRGFCTVVSTLGMPVNLAERLELLSGYRHLEAPRPDGSDANPVAWNHVRLVVGGRRLHVLSRIASAGLDYSGRSNKFAHHVVLEPAELPAAGPAWLLAQPGFMETGWDGQLRLLPQGRSVPQGDVEPAVCQAWQQVAQDAGWAGRLAETILESSGQSSRTVYLIVPRGVDVLSFFAEGVALLPPEHRWEATFSTYYLSLPGDVDCRWRAVYEGTPEAQAAVRQRGVWCLDLSRPLPLLEETPAVLAAREGNMLFLEPVGTTLGSPAYTSSLSPASAGGQPPTDLPEKAPPGPAPPPLVVPPPLVPPRAEPPRLVPIPAGRRRRRLVAGLIALALVLLLCAGVITLWRFPSTRERLDATKTHLLSLLTKPKPQDGARGATQPAAESQPTPGPATQAPSAKGSDRSPPQSKEGRKTQSTSSGHEPGGGPESPAAGRPSESPKKASDAEAPQPPKEPLTVHRTGTGWYRLLPWLPPLPIGSPKTQEVIRDLWEQAKAVLSMMAKQAPKGEDTKPAGCQPSRDGDSPTVRSADATWCRIVDGVAAARSALAGPAPSAGTVLWELHDGQTLEKIELVALGDKETLRVIEDASENGNISKVWRIDLQGVSAIAPKQSIGQLRLEGNRLRWYCTPGKELAKRLEEHIAVLHVKEQTGKDSSIPLQFYRPRLQNELRLVPAERAAASGVQRAGRKGQKAAIAKPTPVFLPVKGWKGMPLPQLDLDSLELGVEGPEACRVENVQPAEKGFRPDVPPESVRQYLLDIGPISADPQGHRQQPLRATMSLTKPHGDRLVITLQAREKPSSSPPNAKPPSLPALIIKKARIFVEVQGYRVTLVEIGAEPAAKGTPPSPGGKEQRNNKTQPVKPTGPKTNLRRNP